MRSVIPFSREFFLADTCILSGEDIFSYSYGSTLYAFVDIGRTSGVGLQIGEYPVACRAHSTVQPLAGLS